MNVSFVQICPRITNQIEFVSLLQGVLCVSQDSRWVVSSLTNRHICTACVCVQPGVQRWYGVSVSEIHSMVPKYFRCDLVLALLEFSTYSSTFMR